MHVNVYKVVQDCVERGVAFGYNRAFKHDATPAAETVKAEVEQAVLHELCEYFTFEQEVPQ